MQRLKSALRVEWGAHIPRDFFLSTINPSWEGLCSWIHITKPPRALWRAFCFYLGGEGKFGPSETSEPCSFPSLLILSRQSGSRAAWKEAEALGTCDGLMPRSVQVCWAPKQQKERGTYQELDGAPKRCWPLHLPTCKWESREEGSRKQEGRVLPWLGRRTPVNQSMCPE